MLASIGDLKFRERLAALWLWQYLSAYNRHLYEREPEALADLEAAVADLQESELVSAEDIEQLAGHYLD